MSRTAISPWTEELFVDDGETGVSLIDFGNAISVWQFMQQGRDVSVAEAATTFNTSPDVVRRAVREHYWLFLNPDDADPSQQIIDQDGE